MKNLDKLTNAELIGKLLQLQDQMFNGNDEAYDEYDEVMEYVFALDDDRKCPIIYAVDPIINAVI